MKTAQSTESHTTPVMPRSCLTPEAEENQLISLAVDAAKRQLIEGTASNSIILHYLKLATTREKIEREIMEKQKELMAAKTEVLASQARVEELYTQAMRAMQKYSGYDNGGADDDEFIPGV